MCEKPVFIVSALFENDQLLPAHSVSAVSEWGHASVI